MPRSLLFSFFDLLFFSFQENAVDLLVALLGTSFVHVQCSEFEQAEAVDVDHSSTAFVTCIACEHALKTLCVCLKTAFALLGEAARDA